MFCTKCGQPLDENMICRNCNQPIQPIQPVQQVVPNNDFQSNYIDPNSPVVENIQPIGPKKRFNYAPIITFLSIIILVLFTIIIKNNFFTEEVVKLEKTTGTRTLMVYMIGSDLETEYGAASSDIEEIMKSGFNEEDLNILIYTGGAKSWDNEKISSEENAIYEVKNNKLSRVKSYDTKDMVKGSTLKEFIDFTYENYETDLYDLILWDHGGGPIYGYGKDEIANTQSLHISDLNNAIRNSKLGNKTQLEYIGFDACLMSSIEVAYSLKDVAKYMVASEEIIPAYGWDYNFLKYINRDTTTEEMTKKIVDKYIDYYSDLTDYYKRMGYKYEPELTLAVTDLSKTADLVQEIDRLFANVGDDISLSNYTKVSNSFSKARLYGYQGSDSTSYDLIDLYGLLSQIDSDYETTKVKSLLKDAVYYEKNNVKGSNGLSIYFPVKNKKNATDYVIAYQELNFSNNYKAFVDKYVSIGKNKLVTSNSKALLPEINNNEISVNLTDDLRDNYLSAKYVIYRKLADNKYMPVNISSDVVLDGNKLYTTGNNKQLIVHPVLKSQPEGTIISPGWVTMLEQNRTDDYAIYAISAVIERYSDKNGLEIESVFLMYKINNGESKGEVIDVVEVNTFGSNAIKGGINLTEWQTIKFMNFSYKLYDEEGNPLDEIQQNKQYYITESDITEDGIDLEFVPLDYDMNTTIKDMEGNLVDETTDEYYYSFIITDASGVNHRTELAKVS